MLHLIFLVARTSLAWYMHPPNLEGTYMDAIWNRWPANPFQTIVMISLYQSHIQ